MTKIVFRKPDGSECIVDAEAGLSVMHVATLNGVEGIVGECGGSAMCATCHIYVEDGEEHLSPMNETENEMLDCTASPRDSHSRLGCQVMAVDSIDRLVVRIPESQV